MINDLVICIGQKSLKNVFFHKSLSFFIRESAPCNSCAGSRYQGKIVVRCYTHLENANGAHKHLHIDEKCNQRCVQYVFSIYVSCVALAHTHIRREIENFRQKAFLAIRRTSCVASACIRRTLTHIERTN